MLKLTWGGQLWVKEYDSRHKYYFLKAKPIFPGGGGIAEFDDLFPFSEGSFMVLCHISQKLEELLDSNLNQECFHVHNDSCKVSFEWVDFNLDFWHLGF